MYTLISIIRVATKDKLKNNISLIAFDIFTILDAIGHIFKLVTMATYKKVFFIICDSMECLRICAGIIHAWMLFEIWIYITKDFSSLNSGQKFLLNREPDFACGARAAAHGRETLSLLHLRGRIRLQQRPRPTHEGRPQDRRQGRNDGLEPQGEAEVKGARLHPYFLRSLACFRTDFRLCFPENQSCNRPKLFRIGIWPDFG